LLSLYIRTKAITLSGAYCNILFISIFKGRHHFVKLLNVVKVHYQIITKSKVKKDPAMSAVHLAGRKDLVMTSKLGLS
jgi:phage terminase small subunit